jgi:hypothetical protein
MLYPSVQQMTSKDINRYALVIATAKGARIITDKLVKEREEAELRRDNKDAKLQLTPDSVNEKAVSATIEKLCTGEYKVVLPNELKKD